MAHSPRFWLDRLRLMPEHEKAWTVLAKFLDSLRGYGILI